MTTQEAFDKIYDHFITNKGLPSMRKPRKLNGGSPVCLYKLNPREPDSPRCALGIFIKEYKPVMEKYYIHTLITKGIIPKLEGIENPDSFWIKIQTCHDSASRCGSEFCINMESNLYSFAKLFDLECKPLSLEAGKL